MNFRQLTYFIAVAEELHFGRAADRLDMAQPPLSRQIKQLEEELGAILFNRGRSAITMTQAGQRLLERGKSILAQLEDTQLEVRRLGSGRRGASAHRLCRVRNIRDSSEHHQVLPRQLPGGKSQPQPDEQRGTAQGLGFA